MEADIDEGIEAGNPQYSENSQIFPALLDQGPLGNQVLQGERQKDEECNSPSPEGEGDGRNNRVHCPAQYKVAGPEQGSKNQENIWGYRDAHGFNLYRPKKLLASKTIWPPFALCMLSPNSVPLLIHYELSMQGLSASSLS